jgi:hypothetical protein
MARPAKVIVTRQQTGPPYRGQSGRFQLFQNPDKCSDTFRGRRVIASALGSGRSITTIRSGMPPDKQPCQVPPRSRRANRHVNSTLSQVTAQGVLVIE